ncbi:MAG: AAA family ATPase, partial [Clostridia bacterium]|nr:AAA family ATPase [Clostridia bacterium]
QAYLKTQNIQLTAEDVRQVISQMTGVPVTELSREERDKLVHLEEELSKRVIGQNQAVKVVSLAVRRQRAGLKDPNKPIGSFIFVGPTGSGKTELTKALADCLFGSDADVIRIDMSEYMEKQSTAKLIGAPPGYAGYDEGGYLTEKVHRKPYSVVLFDEIEKAHPDVFNLLLQILDEGRLTDSHGKTVDFRNTVIIMTSNIGVTDTKTSMGFAPTNDYQAMHDSVERALKKFFRPEFLNRVDEIVVFNYLGREETLKITELLCFGLVKRLRGTLNLRFTDKAIQLLANVGFDKDYGARPLKRAIQRYVEDALAEQLLDGKIAKGDTVVVDAQNNKISFYKQ